jgi:antitoxin PrlF
LRGITIFEIGITFSGRSAMATTVTSKGQVTIPKLVREHLGIAPGSQVEFRRAADGSIVIEKADGKREPSRIAKVLGSAGPGMTTDELMALLRGEPE